MTSQEDKSFLPLTIQTNHHILKETVNFNRRSKSVSHGTYKPTTNNPAVHEPSTQLLEQLKKKNGVLEKSLEPLFAKNSHTISRQEKKIDNISRELEKRDVIIVEKDKEIKLY